MFSYITKVPIYNWELNIYIDIADNQSELDRLKVELQSRKDMKPELLESIFNCITSDQGDTLWNPNLQVQYIIIGKLFNLKDTLKQLDHEFQHSVDFIGAKHDLEFEAKGYLRGWYVDMAWESGLAQYIYEKFPNPFQTRIDG